MANALETAGEAKQSPGGQPLPAALAGGSASANESSGQASSLGILSQLGASRIVALGLVALALIGFFTFIVFRVTEPRYTLLFGSLEIADSQEIIGRLEGLNVPYRLSQDGTAIMVPEDRALRLRMQLVEDGMPTGSSLGYEIFDRDAMFGTTDFVSNVNLKRALEGELARTIASLSPVRAARVHLVLPERELFRPEPEAPSASVFLKLRTPSSLSSKQVLGIQHLVGAAVPGMEPSRVAILDGDGRLLARGDDESEMAMLSAEEEHRVAVEERLRRKVVQLLERSLGPGKVEAQVTAEMNFEEVTTSAEIFDPESQVARSTQAVEEETQIAEQEPDGDVSVANALPGAEPAAGDGPKSTENVVRTEETTNYEISRTVRNETRRGGTIERLSVAVQVDGRYSEDASGNLVFSPLPEGELAELEALVQSAIGLDEGRGDRLQIASLRFHRPEAIEPEASSLFELSRNDYWRIGELGLMAILTLSVLQFAVRPILKSTLPTRSQPAAPAGSAAVAGPETAAPRLTQRHDKTMPTPAAEGGNQAPTGQASRASGTSEAYPAAEPPEEDMVSLKQIAGKVRASLVQEVTEIIEERPDDATRVLRGWLHSD